MVASLEGLNVFCLLHRSCRSHCNALLRLGPPLEQYKNLKQNKKKVAIYFTYLQRDLLFVRIAFLSIQCHHI